MREWRYMVLYEVSSVFLLLNPIAHWALLRLNQRVDQDPLTHLRQASEHLSSRTGRIEWTEQFQRISKTARHGSHETGLVKQEVC